MGENAERIRRGVELFNEGKVAEVMDLYADDVHAESWGSVIGGTYRGKKELGDWFQKIAEAYSGGIKLELENVVEHGDQVFAEWITKGTLSNGKPTEAKVANVFEFRGPKVSRHRLYTDTERLARDMGTM